MADCGDENYDEVLWDEIFEKCYYTCNGELISMNKAGSLKTTVATNVRSMIYFAGSDEHVGYVDTDGAYYVVINNNVFEK
jgi:hypothetical protein